MNQENLIFLISQPRSGSTLIQKILGSHEEIYTRSEPWIMLYPAFSLKNFGKDAIYGSNLENEALNDFISDLPSKEEFYVKKLHEMYLSLYESYLKKNHKTYFLDKTPRYYFIRNELQKIFPQAKQIILIRNPLAVLSSMINKKDHLEQLSDNRYDLIEAIPLLLEALNNKSSTQFILHYEKFLSEQKETITELCNFINITYHDYMLTDYLDKNNKWLFGDQKIYAQKSIDTTKTTQWIKYLKDPQKWRLFYDYLHHIGEKNFEQLGYSFSENLKILQTNMPLNTLDEIKEKTFSLMEFLIPTENGSIQINRQKQLEKQLHEKMRIIEEKEAHIQKQAQDKQDLNLQLEQKNKQLQDKNKQLQDKEAHIQKQAQDKQDLNLQLEQKNKQLQDKEAHIQKQAQDKQDLLMQLKTMKAIIDINGILHPIRKKKALDELTKIKSNFRER